MIFYISALLHSTFQQYHCKQQNTSQSIHLLKTIYVHYGIRTPLNSMAKITLILNNYLIIYWSANVFELWPQMLLYFYLYSCALLFDKHSDPKNPKFSIFPHQGS